MCTGTIAQDFIGNQLIGIAKIKIAFLKARYGGNVQGLPPLVVQETVGDPQIIVVFKIVEPELRIEVGHRSAITLEQLKEDGGLYFHLAVLVLGKAHSRIDVIVPKGVRLKGRIETLQAFVQDIGSVQTEIELSIAIEYPQVKIVVGGGLVVRGQLSVALPEILHIDPELVEVVGDSEGQKDVVVAVHGQMVGKGHPCPPLLGFPIAVVVEQHSQARSVPHPCICGQGLGIRGILDPHPLGQSVQTDLDMVPDPGIGRGHQKGIVRYILGELGDGELLPLDRKGQEQEYGHGFNFLEHGVSRLRFIAGTV